MTPVCFLSDRLMHGYSALWRHEMPAGFGVVPILTRFQLNLRALGWLLVSAEFLRLLLWLAVWQLLAAIVVWQFDLADVAAIAPGLGSLFWVLPWVANLRSRCLLRVLRDHPAILIG